MLNVKLDVLCEGVFQYRAGQYLDMILSDQKCRTFSIASSPDCGNVLEFHLRDVEAGGLERLLRAHFKRGSRLQIDGPKGDYCLKMKSEKPLIMLAGGTGFAPVKSMLEYGMKRGLNRQILLYWGARTRDDLYCDHLIRDWLAGGQETWLNYVPVLSEEPWEGRAGYVHDALLADVNALANYEVYASGSPQMIKSSYEAFLAHGLPESSYYSDVLDYAKTLA